MTTITVATQDEMNGILQLNGTMVGSHKLSIQQDKTSGSGSSGGGFQQPKSTKVHFNKNQVTQFLLTTKYDSTKNLIFLDNLQNTGK